MSPQQSTYIPESSGLVTYVSDEVATALTEMEKMYAFGAVVQGPDDFPGYGVSMAQNGSKVQFVFTGLVSGWANSVNIRLYGNTRYTDLHNANGIIQLENGTGTATRTYDSVDDMTLEEIDAAGYMGVAYRVTALSTLNTGLHFEDNQELIAVADGITVLEADSLSGNIEDTGSVLDTAYCRFGYIGYKSESIITTPPIELGVEGGAVGYEQRPVEVEIACVDTGGFEVGVDEDETYPADLGNTSIAGLFASVIAGSFTETLRGSFRDSDKTVVIKSIGGQPFEITRISTEMEVNA